MNKYILFALVTTSVTVAAKTGALSPRDIMAANETASRVPNVKAEATLTNKEPNGTEKAKVFTYWRKLGKDGIHFRTLTYFSEPAEIRGEQVLFTEQDGDKADVLMYLPAYKKTRRVEKQSHSGSFMNSEFSYADIATPHLDDFTYKGLPDAPCADKGVCSVIIVTPKTDDVRDRTGYGRTVNWIRNDSKMISKAEYYDTKGKLIKRLTASEVKEVDPANHRYMNQHLLMENLVNHRQTTIQFHEINTKEPIADSKFSPQNLGKD